MIWDLNTWVMVDPDRIADAGGSSMVREEATKHEGNPIVGIDQRAINPGGRGEQIQLTLVVRQDGRYRLWYRLWSGADARRGVTGKTAPLYYAESDDGLRFKPVRVHRQRGLPANQLNQGLDDHARGMRTSGYFHDPLDQEYPFKCVVYRPGSSDQFDPGALARYPHYRQRKWDYIWGIGRSKDGIAWEPPGHEHNLIATMPEHARLHRAADGGLVIADQMMSGMADWAYRNVKGWITYDSAVAHRIPDYLYSLPQHMVRCRMEYTGPSSDGKPWIQPHVGLVVARKGPTFLALHGYLYGANAYETFAQTAEIGLSFGATGVQFHDVWPFMPFIRRGLRGQWDQGMVRQDAIIDDGEQTRFYFTGNNVGNLNGIYQGGVASIERDRYGYRLIAGGRDQVLRPREATFTLKPLPLPPRPRLAVNVSQVGAGRDVRIELRDERGKAMRGYGFDDCVPITRPGIARVVRWKGRDDCRELAGRTVTVAVHLRSRRCGTVGTDSPRVYAIYTASHG